MCGVIVVDAGRSRSTNLGRDAYIMIIASISSWLFEVLSIAQTVICLPVVCYFSREKPLVKSTAPGSLLYHICLWDLFLFAFIFRSINTKTQKYLAVIYCNLFYLVFPRDLFIQSTTILPIFLPVRDWQHLFHVGLQVFVLCVQVPFT